MSKEVNRRGSHSAGVLDCSIIDKSIAPFIFV
jgi:hypothetical protein